MKVFEIMRKIAEASFMYVKAILHFIISERLRKILHGLYMTFGNVMYNIKKRYGDEAFLFIIFVALLVALILIGFSFG
jgi:hypothetical protein